jgi:hypothetical protein
MTGEQLLRYLERRLGVDTTPDDDLGPEELYDYLTEARDEVRRRLSMAAPRLQLVSVTLEAGSGTREYVVPSDMRDPIAVEAVRVLPSKRRLRPSASLDQDGGDYQWRDPRTLLIGEHVDIGQGVELEVTLDLGAINSQTAELAIGVPTWAHRAVGKLAALLAQSKDDRSDGRIALQLYEREMAQLEDRFATFDGQGGGELREAMLASYGEHHGDELY